MKIAGVIKNSFVDFPGRIATVVFVPGCNMNCWYCHNAGIKEDKSWTEEKLFQFLTDRKDFIDGVVLSGGEITLQKDLESIVRRIKDLGLQVKLDTNGLNPEIVKKLVNQNLIDYIAMDIKAPFEKYNQITRVKCDTQKIEESIKFVMDCGVDYEFRTTFSPDLTHADILDIAKNVIPNAKLYAVQQYRTECYCGTLSEEPHSDAYVLEAVEIASPYVKKCIARGITVPNAR